MASLNDWASITTEGFHFGPGEAPVDHAAGAARVRARIESMAPNLRASPEFRELTPEETAATRAMLEERLG